MVVSQLLGRCFTKEPRERLLNFLSLEVIVLEVWYSETDFWVRVFHLFIFLFFKIRVLSLNINHTYLGFDTLCKIGSGGLKWA